MITTASDAAGVVALDGFGADLGFVVEPGSDLAAVGTAVLSGLRVTLSTDTTWPLPPLPSAVVAGQPEPAVPAIIVTDRARLEHDAPTVVYRPPSLVIGLGSSRGVPPEEIDALIDQTLSAANLSPRSVCAAATVDLKQNEPGLVAAVAKRGWPLVTFPATALAEVPVPNPSDAVRAAVGTPSVAEAAALLAARDPTPTPADPNPGIHSSPTAPATLVVPKQTSPHATVADRPPHPPGPPGHRRHRPGSPRPAHPPRRGRTAPGPHRRRPRPVPEPGRRPAPSRHRPAFQRPRPGTGAGRRRGRGRGGGPRGGPHRLGRRRDLRHGQPRPGVGRRDDRRRRRARRDRGPGRRGRARRTTRPRPRHDLPVRPAHPVGGRSSAGSARRPTPIWSSASTTRPAGNGTGSSARPWPSWPLQRPPGTPVGWVRDATRPGQSTGLAHAGHFRPSP